VIEAPGGPADLVARVNAWRRDASSCNGTFARRIPHLLGRLGLVVIEVAAFALMFTYPRDAFGLPGWVAYAIELGGRFGRTTSGSGRRGSPLLPTRAASSSSSPTWSAAGRGLHSGGARRAAAPPASICWFALCSADA
jgi:hypothetical protein